LAELRVGRCKAKQSTIHRQLGYKLNIARRRTYQTDGRLMTDDKANNPSQDSGERLRAIESQDILKGHQEVLIDHQGTMYKLRLTKAGKLILTKP
jgi:hemin uptake protein HemP